MKNLKYCILFTVMLAMTSCAKWTAPAYTSVDKITKVKAGMSVDEVNSTLGITPYDIYNIQEDGTTILVYNYRLKERRMTVPSSPKRQSEVIHGDERSQTEGTTWYTDPSVLYAFYQNGKLKSVISDKGREDAEYIALINNNIQLIASDKLVSLAAGGTAVYLMNEKGDLNAVNLQDGTNKVNNKAVVLPIKQEIGKYKVKAKEGSVKSKNKGLKTALKVVGVAAGAFIVLSLILAIVG